MQQLTLFSNKHGAVFDDVQINDGKTPVLHQVGATRWDLWTQETEMEKEMALFFLDIRNFTPLVEKHQAIDVIHIVKKLFSKFQNIIRVHRGQIIETSGDGFYAAFGFDRGAKEAVNASVQAGMAILETLDNLNIQSFEKTIGQRIDVGIGIHVGKVATGNLHLGFERSFCCHGTSCECGFQTAIGDERAKQ